MLRGIFLAKCVRTFRAPKCARAVRWIVRSNRSTTRGWGWRCWWTGENCLNFQGLRCDVCYRECPKIDEAITLELERNTRTGKHARFLPTVHSDACTGCGKCEKVCVLEQPAIKVLPLSLAKGELGHHYRFGWLEGNNGKS